MALELWWQQWSLYISLIIYRFAEKKGEIDKLAEDYIANVKNLASEQRVEHLQKIQNAYSKCKEFSDDKVQLAMQTYEMVSLNADFQEFAILSVAFSYFEYLIISR